MHAKTSAARTRRLILLGSTGSIGCSTLEVLEHLHRCTDYRFEVVGLASGRKGARLVSQARAWRTEHVAVADDAAASDVQGFAHAFRGESAAEDLVRAVAQRGDLVVGAMVGSAGLPAIIAAIEAGCDIALANKETLVAAGSIVMPLARKHGVRIIPIDSEHSAIFQCLASGRAPAEIRRVVLTASGGPFRTWPREKMARATVEEALAHPTWNMGAKVTIDSATLMNKALEVIEAHWLFDLAAAQIDAIIHPQSIVHSFVEFVDGSVIAQMSPPDMKAPIQYALTWPDRAASCAPALNWSELRALKFEPVDHARFPSIGLAKRVIETGGTAGAILNAANEVAVAAFLEEQIAFGDITDIVSAVIDEAHVRPIESLDDVRAADAKARAIASRFVKQRRMTETATAAPTI